ncbi:MAG TPA: prepilin-type N-terminal cleavage/methylation domain-containing protein [Polyangiaceae bacterium]
MSKTSERGFTLIEMLTVVAIVGVLATLAVYGVQKYVFASKSSEAMTMITSIKANQEAFKDETFAYLNVSLGSFRLYPSQAPGRFKSAWSQPTHPDFARWQQLGVDPNGPVAFGYAVTAGAAGTSPTTLTTEEPLNYPVATTEPWYIVVARADHNGDGVRSLLVSSSFTREVYVEKEDE